MLLVAWWATYIGTGQGMPMTGQNECDTEARYAVTIFPPILFAMGR